MSSIVQIMFGLIVTLLKIAEDNVESRWKKWFNLIFKFYFLNIWTFVFFYVKFEYNQFD